MKNHLTKVVFAKLDHEKRDYITVDSRYIDKHIDRVTKTDWKYDMDKIYWWIDDAKWEMNKEEIKNFDIGINIEWERITNLFLTSQPYNYWWYAVFFSMA